MKYNSNVLSLKIPNSLLDYKLLYFDIFLKNYELFLIVPVYNSDVNFIKKIKIISNGVNLTLKRKLLKINLEPIIILVYSFNSDNNNIILKYDNIVKHYNLEHIKTTKIYKLTLTTLFLDDYYLFNTFYNYYKNQGVEHFYMYYNNKIDENVKNYFKGKNDVTLIEWNFKYWNDELCGHTFKHHAQIGQIHHAIHKYGKDISEYMIFCDLDEFMFCPYTKLINKINSKYNSYVFYNIHSESLDNSKLVDLPNRFRIGNKYLTYCTKCIHKLDSIDTICIHFRSYFMLYIITKLYLFRDYNNYLFHFYSIGSKNKRKFKCDNVIDITLMKQHDKNDYFFNNTNFIIIFFSFLIYFLIFI